MVNSLIPADQEIRVLLTIRNGQVTERQLLNHEFVATLEGFAEMLRDAGFIGSVESQPGE